MFKNIQRRIEFATYCTVHRSALHAISRWQTVHLRKLLEYAFENVPIWREILGHTHLNADVTSELLSRIPLTSKNTYTGKMIEEYIDNSHWFHQRWHTTSGSTGTPFRFLLASRTMRATFNSEFDCFRFLLWRGKSFRDLSATRIAILKQSAPANDFRLYLSYADFRENTEAIIKQLIQFRPEVLSAYPAVLFDLARMKQNDRISESLAPRYIVSVGDMLTPPLRSFVRQEFNCEVYDRYGLEEIGSIGVECAMHNGFHINCESIILEITDAQGSRLPDESYGHVIVTDLYNYNMPFIRYDTGDIGRVSTEPCECGLFSPRLWLRGRKVAQLTFGSRTVFRHEFLELDSLTNQVLQHQIVKKGEAHMVVRVVCGPVWSYESALQIEKGIRKFMGSEIEIEIEPVSHIQKRDSGKSELLVDESRTLQ